MIEIHELTKRCGSTVAVDGLSFGVREGEVTGFLGPNGAGRSTTMRMMVGLDTPTSGRVAIDGDRYGDLRVPLRHVGALLEARAIHPGRSARSHLRWLADSNGIDRRRVDEILDQGRPHRRGEPPDGRVLPRQGPTPRHHYRPARRPGDAAARRTSQRPRPRRHPVDPPTPSLPRRRGAVASRRRSTGTGSDRRSPRSEPATPGPNLTFHFTPTSSPWLNLVERWFADPGGTSMLADGSIGARGTWAPVRSERFASHAAQRPVTVRRAGLRARGDDRTCPAGRATRCEPPHGTARDRDRSAPRRRRGSARCFGA